MKLRHQFSQCILYKVPPISLGYDKHKRSNLRYQVSFKEYWIASGKRKAEEVLISLYVHPDRFSFMIHKWKNDKPIGKLIEKDIIFKDFDWKKN